MDKLHDGYRLNCTMDYNIIFQCENIKNISTEYYEIYNLKEIRRIDKDTYLSKLFGKHHCKFQEIVNCDLARYAYSWCNSFVGMCFYQESTVYLLKSAHLLSLISTY